MPFKLGPMPSKRSLEYLSSGNLVLRTQVKSVLLAYNTSYQRSNGTTDFVDWHWAQLQFQNPNIFFYKQKDITPNPYFQVFLDNAREILIDLDWHTRQDVENRLTKAFGKTSIVLEREALEAEIGRPPANFGSDCRRQCICEVQGQMPCPRVLDAPRHHTGLWRRNYEHQEETLLKHAKKAFMVPQDD